MCDGCVMIYQSMRKHEKPSLTEERDALHEEVTHLLLLLKMM